LYSPWSCIHTSNAISSLVRAARPPPTACKHRHRAAARPPAQAAPGSAVTYYMRNPSLMDYYSVNRPRRDGRLSQPCWSTDRGRFTQKVVRRPAVSLAQDMESSPARIGGLTSMLRHQLVAIVVHGWSHAMFPIPSTDKSYHVKILPKPNKSHFYAEQSKLGRTVLEQKYRQMR